MARSPTVVWIAIALSLAVAATGGAPGLAQQPLPTPRGQLGGREPLDPTWPAGIVAPTPPTPSPGAPVAAEASREAGRFAPVAAIAARSTVVVRVWRGNASSASAGWVWGTSGRVVTASGNVENADRIEVAAADGVWVVAALLDADPAIGVAVLTAPGLDVPPLDLAPARAGMGDAVAAVRPAIGREREPAWTVGTTRLVESGEVVLVELAGGDGPWTPGAPVVAESGLVGMALSVPDSQAKAGATDGSESGRADAASMGRIAAFVPIDTIRDSVSAQIEQRAHPRATTQSPSASR